MNKEKNGWMLNAGGFDRKPKVYTLQCSIGTTNISILLTMMLKYFYYNIYYYYYYL